MVIQAKLGLLVDVSEMPGPVEFSIVPPVPAEPFPVTLRPPLAPVVFSTIPLDAPFDEIDRNVRPLAPIVVLATVSAVAVVVAIQFVPLAVTVPPPVRLSPAVVVFVIVMSARVRVP